MGLIRLVTPHLCIESVLELSADRLRSLGIDALLLDVDCTLKRYREEYPDVAVATWIAGLRAEGFGVCLFSNGRKQRIGRVAERLGVPFVSNACKPLPLRCGDAVRRLGARRERTAIVGDQVFADILAGRLAGLFTIFVRPIHPEDEPWFTRLKRPLEARLIRAFLTHPPIDGK